MSSFTARVTTTSDVTIKNEPFYPAIALQNVRNAMRIHDAVTNDRLRQAVVMAIAEVNEELRSWKEQQPESVLVDVPVVFIDEKSLLEVHYLNAVFNLAKALLIDTHSDIDTTAKGDDDNTQLLKTVDRYRQSAHASLSAILGKNKDTVELI